MFKYKACPRRGTSGGTQGCRPGHPRLRQSGSRAWGGRELLSHVNPTRAAVHLSLLRRHNDIYKYSRYTGRAFTVVKYGANPVLAPGRGSRTRAWEPSITHGSVADLSSDMPGPRDAFYTLLLFAPVLLWGYYRKRSNERSSHPPSPTSLPLVGNLFSLPSGPEHVMYMQIGRQLKSDIVYLSLLGHEIVVLNSSKAASELLDKRSASYSDRFCPLIITDQDLWV
ncbi:cytochrome P450 domain-containing protein [Rhizoctonia solani AG-1 IA]|uniref:Cytochrome P450 domain-containing protein n=1 Tax=Thanatephorus cucumeris (strain AG1-IA) TaxID=983506 RepID=L8WNS0_THACA|nr:cytochrome P450 domain-containing protein [Rhizoctonia solani AG-1 IA]